MKVPIMMVFVAATAGIFLGDTTAERFLIFIAVFAAYMIGIADAVTTLVKNAPPPDDRRPLYPPADWADVPSPPDGRRTSDGA